MSHPLSDAESKLVFDRLSRRARLLKSLRHNPLRSPWYLIPYNAFFFGLASMLGVLLVWSQGSTLAILAGLAGVGLVTTIELHIAATNRRIDSLIELLQQERVLDNPPATTARSEP
jgi:hypothetical protein